MSDLIRAKLKEIVDLRNIIKKDYLNYKSKRRKTYNFSKYLLAIVLLRDIPEGYLSIEKADNKQSNFFNELNIFDKGTKTLLDNVGLLFSAREKVLDCF